MRRNDDTIQAFTSASQGASTVQGGAPSAALSRRSRCRRTCVEIKHWAPHAVDAMLSSQQMAWLPNSLVDFHTAPNADHSVGHARAAHHPIRDRPRLHVLPGDLRAVRLRRLDAAARPRRL